LWEDLGERHYWETGTLCIASREGEAAAGEWMHKSAVTLERCGHKPEMLDQSRLSLRFPLIDPSDVEGGLYLPSGGVLFADKILDGLKEYLDDHDVALRPKTKVVEVDVDRARLVLEGGETVEADAVIVAAGAWINRLMPALRPRLTPSRQVLAYMHPPEELDDLWAKSPIILDIDPMAGFYAVPPRGGTQLKLGDHRYSLEGDPDAPRKASEAEIEQLAARCGRRLTGWAGYRLERLEVCFYIVEPQQRFIVERAGKAGWVLSACSGHGFKFGPVIGQRLAEAMILDKPEQLTAWAAGKI
jgi:glycine/D-amino acid oxidase-like deaminating enzyme